MTKKIKEMIDELKEIIWGNQNITSYGLLAKYIEKGYKYTNYGEESFENLLSGLKSDSNITYDKDEDKFHLYREYTIKIMLDRESKRQNCYGCGFCIKEDSETVHCSLNPTLDIRLSMTYITKECPINMMINQENLMEITKPSN